MIKKLIHLTLCSAVLFLSSCGASYLTQDVKRGVVSGKSYTKYLQADDGKTYKLGKYKVGSSYSANEKVVVTGDITDTGSRHLEFIDYTVQSASTYQEAKQEGDEAKASN